MSGKKITVLLLILAFVPAVLSGCGFSGARLRAVKDLGENCFSCTYKDTERTWLEYAPEGEAKGIVILLHGAGSSGAAFRQMTGFDEKAAPKGYVSVYVDGLKDPTDKTSAPVWNSGMKPTNPVDDSGFLNDLAKHLQRKYHLSKDETFAAGFSNGALMAYRIALEGQDRYRAVASVCGDMAKAMWENKGEKAGVGLLQISGTADDVVPMHANDTHLYNGNPAIEDVVEWFAGTQGLTLTSETELSERSILYEYSSPDSEQRVRHIIIRQGHHGWSEEKYVGFNATDVVLDFFESYYD